jgi:hypothetical protein
MSGWMSGALYYIVEQKYNVQCNRRRHCNKHIGLWYVKLCSDSCAACTVYNSGEWTIFSGKVGEMLSSIIIII